MDYGRVYLAEKDDWYGSDDLPKYVAVIWSPEERGGKAKQVWRSERLADPEAAFQAMVRAAKKRKAPVEVWRHGNVRVGLVGGGRKLEAA